MTDPRRRGYRAEDRLGASGIEATYEECSRKAGQEAVRGGCHGAAGSDLSDDEPDPGHNLTLSLDVELQKDVKAPQAGMGESLYAVAIVMDPRNGQILSMVSVPTYDNNLFCRGVRSLDLQRLLDDPRKPMIDYSIRRDLPPGSTFKLVTAARRPPGKGGRCRHRDQLPGALLIPNQYNPALTQRLPCWGVHGKQDFVGLCQLLRRLLLDPRRRHR